MICVKKYCKFALRKHYFYEMKVKMIIIIIVFDNITLALLNLTAKWRTNIWTPGEGKWIPNKNHYTVLTYIEATQKTQLENKQKKNIAEPYNNLT